MEFDVMKVIDAAIETGVVSDDVDAMRLTKFVLLMQGVRAAALVEAIELCRVVADKAHLSMWEYRSHGLLGCADLERSRVDTAELIQRALEGKIKHESGACKKDEGRQGDPSQAGSAGRAEARAVGAIRPESGAASPAAQADAPVTGGEHG